ncbi:MAG: DUF2877 domain-containing protein [Chloroflexi bacterium]|nr:DUF2877 domain-containing protein [Chloroflexota bacterium]
MNALSIAPAARAWLAQTSRARVLHSFPRIVYLANERDEILALATRALGNLPFGIVVDAEGEAFREVRAEARVVVAGARIELDALTIDAAGAAEWQPMPEWRALCDKSVDAAQLAALAMEFAPRGSLLEIILPQRRREKKYDPSAEFTLSEAEGLRAGLRITNYEFAFLARARAPALQLIQAARAREIEKAVAAARELAGLGNGLTPAGDDFIVGALLGAWMRDADAEEFCARIADAAAPRTTKLSAAFLRAASCGQCTERWHNFFAALRADDAGTTRVALGALMQTGHTSGADAFAGWVLTQTHPSAIFSTA